MISEMIRQKQIAARPLGVDTIMLANKPMLGNVNIGNADLAAHVPTQELIVALSIL